MPTPKNMICPKCGNGSVYVIDSRAIKDRTAIKRRRQCSDKECLARFTTFEVMAVDIKHVIVIDEWPIGPNQMADIHGGILG